MMQLFIKKLTVLDFSYLDYQRGLVGESWIVDVFLKGDLDEEGMIQDFGLVKRNLKTCLEDVMDHKLVIPLQAPRVKLNPESTQVEFYDQAGFLYQQKCPAQALCALDDTTINRKIAIEALEKAARQVVPNSVAEITIQLRTENIPGAFYHYSHGLKKHKGNCQRIAHGHRSKIEIFTQDQPRPDLEAQWAQQWADIYLGTRENIIAEPMIEGEKYYQFAYEAPQGYYELTLPQSRVYLMETETTVEQISAHIAECIGKDNKEVKIWAYEGLDKGAISNHTGQ